MRFELTFDVVYKTQATCTIEADTEEEAKKVAEVIARDLGEANDRILDDWDEPLDWDNRTLKVSKVEGK